MKTVGDVDQRVQALSFYLDEFDGDLMPSIGITRQYYFVEALVLSEKELLYSN